MVNINDTRDTYIDKLMNGKELRLTESQAMDMLNNLEVFMAKREMNLYADKVLVNTSTLKRNIYPHNGARDWRDFLSIIKSGFPYTSIDDSEGFLQIKLDFTQNEITRIK